MTHDGALDFDRCYRALATRDTRFDGQFYATVRTTGIYCRPSCPAATPKPQNVAFTLTAAAAQTQGFRACRRCLPDAVPGSPRWNTQSDLASRGMRLIGDGEIDRSGVAGLAATLGYSSRQLTRIMTAELGAGPLALARAQRASNAHTLIAGTALPMGEIAFAAGFSSIRQFNDTIAQVYACTPSQLRRRSTHTTPSTGSLTVKLPVRQPFSSRWLLWQLSSHAVDGIEAASDNTFRRSLHLPRGYGVVTLTMFPDQVRADLTLTDLRDLGASVTRLRRLIDSEADVVAINEHFASIPGGSELTAQCPGIRVPGAVDPSELLLRTMIGQQISVAAACTHLARLVEHCGPTLPDALCGPSDGITRLFPTPADIAQGGYRALAGPRRRIESIRRTCELLADGSVALHPGLPAADLHATLLTLPGVGEWTASYVTMRAVGDPDRFLHTDLVVRRSADEMRRVGMNFDFDATDWAPWRSYLSMHLWHRAMLPPEASTPTEEICS